MATIPERTHETSIGAVRGQWAALCEYLEEFSPWLLVAAYAVLSAGLLAGAALAAVYLSVAVSGMAGFVVFFTVGLGLVAAVPVAARRLFALVLNAIEA